jgi:hypothetical protein
MGMRVAGWPLERVADQKPVPCEWVCAQDLVGPLAAIKTDLTEQ